MTGVVKMTFGDKQFGGFDIDIRAVARNAAEIFLLLNQIAAGDREKCRAVVNEYGGSRDAADRLWNAAKDIIVR